MNQQLLNDLHDWAAHNPRIARLWIFGSRAVGTHREDSGLDVAVDIEPVRPTDENAFAAYFHDVPQWSSELQSFFPYDVHLYRYDPTEKVGKLFPTSTVATEVERYAMQVYPSPPKPTTE